MLWRVREVYLKWLTLLMTTALAVEHAKVNVLYPVFLPVMTNMLSTLMNASIVVLALAYVP